MDTLIRKENSFTLHNYENKEFYRTCNFIFSNGKCAVLLQKLRVEYDSDLRVEWVRWLNEPGYFGIDELDYDIEEGFSLELARFSGREWSLEPLDVVLSDEDSKKLAALIRIKYAIKFLSEGQFEEFEKDPLGDYSYPCVYVLCPPGKGVRYYRCDLILDSYDSAGEIKWSRTTRQRINEREYNRLTKMIKE